MNKNNSFDLPEQLGTGAKLAVNAATPRKNFDVQFAHLLVTVENAPSPTHLDGTAVAGSIDDRIRRMREARADELRRRGKN